MPGPEKKIELYIPSVGVNVYVACSELSTCSYYVFSNIDYLKFYALHNVFTVRCTIVQSVVLRSHVICPSVCLSVCDVDGPHRLKILESNCMNN